MIFLPCKLELDLFSHFFTSRIVMRINILDAFWLIRVEKFRSKEYFNILIFCLSRNISSELSITLKCVLMLLIKKTYVRCTFVIKSDGREGDVNESTRVLENCAILTQVE